MLKNRIDRIKRKACIQVAALLVVLISTGHLLARVRIERFVEVAWVLLIPLALINIFVSGAFLL